MSARKLVSAAEQQNKVTRARMNTPSKSSYISSIVLFVDVYNLCCVCVDCLFICIDVLSKSLDSAGFFLENINAAIDNSVCTEYVMRA